MRILSFALVLTVLAPQLSAAAPRPLEFHPATYSTGNAAPFYVATGDLDGDASADIVSANYDGGTLAVFLNNGKGNFTRSGIFAAVGNPIRVELVDLEADGHLDIVSANNNGSALVSTWRGNGDGTFGERRDYQAPLFGLDLGPRALLVEDFTGDGSPDLALAGTNYGFILVFGNAGDGTFAPATKQVVPGFTTAGTHGDLDGNGSEDIVLVGWGNRTDSFQVLLGGGDGSFDLSFPTARTEPRGVSVADLNRDGKLDAVISDGGPSNGGNNIGVRLGNGDGTFGPRTAVRTGARPSHSLVADVDGDDKVDIVVANRHGASISFLKGNGKGYFHPGVDFAVGGEPINVRAADFNGDGKLDLVVSNAAGRKLTVLLSR